MKVRITHGMFIALIIDMMYGKGIGITQGIIAREVGGDMWLANIFATLQGVGMMFLTVLIIRRTPDKNIMEQTQLQLGMWAGKLVSMTLFVFFLGAFGASMITFVYHFLDYFLPETPILLFILVGLLVGGYANYLGFEVMARMALIGAFFLLFLNILLLVGSVKDLDIQELMPVFQSGGWNTVWASRHFDTDWAMATLMAAVLLPMVEEKKGWGQAGIAGILFGGLFVTKYSVLEVGVLSPEVTAQYIVACMQLARSAEIGFFLHRYELIMIAFFSISLLVQFSMCLFCGCIAASHMVGLKDYRPIIVPVSLLFGGFSYWLVFDHNRAMFILSQFWYSIALTIGFGLPISLWLLGFLLNKKTAM